MAGPSTSTSLNIDNNDDLSMNEHLSEILPDTSIQTRKNLKNLEKKMDGILTMLKSMQRSAKKVSKSRKSKPQLPSKIRAQMIAKHTSIYDEVKGTESHIKISVDSATCVGKSFLRNYQDDVELVFMENSKNIYLLEGDLLMEVLFEQGGENFSHYKQMVTKDKTLELWIIASTTTYRLTFLTKELLSAALGRLCKY